MKGRDGIFGKGAQQMGSPLLNRFNKNLIRRVIWTAKKKTIPQILASRCRRENQPEFGRFNKLEIKRIAAQVEPNIASLMPFFQDLENVGNYLTTYGGLIDLAIYRALVDHGIDKEYAVNLVGDMQWQSIVNAKGTIPIIDPLLSWFWSRTIKDPLEILGKRLQLAMKFPYGEPGYKMKVSWVKNVYHMDIFACPVYDFFKQFGPEEIRLFRRTHCTFDFAIANFRFERGRYQRAHTLSDGDEVCDMRWSVALAE
jgi:hypothetical protein